MMISHWILYFRRASLKFSWMIVKRNMLEEWGQCRGGAIVLSPFRLFFLCLMKVMGVFLLAECRPILIGRRNFVKQSFYLEVVHFGDVRLLKNTVSTSVYAGPVTGMMLMFLLEFHGIIN